MSQIGVPPSYVGREQAYIKHVFLRLYLERLVHKIASAADEVVYVDGFSGPWKSSDEAYQDTSFGIALRALSDARHSWASMAGRSRQVRMAAHLVEADATAYAQLRSIGQHFPTVSVHTHHGDFQQLAPGIAQVVPAGAFSFVLADPKGFVDMASLRPLIGRDRCEVVFNFMFDYVNRFPSLAQLAPTYDRMFPGLDWRGRIGALGDGARPEDRKRVFLELFKEAVRVVGGYRYVADVDIQYPGRDRTFYFLVYGTRRAPGLEVFRDCQLKALESQSIIGGRLRVQNVSAATGQLELLGSANDMRADPVLAFKEAEKVEARRHMVRLVRPGGRAWTWGDLWPAVLAEHAVRRTDANQIAADLKKIGMLVFPDWGERKRVPEDGYRVVSGSNWDENHF